MSQRRINRNDRTWRQEVVSDVFGQKLGSAKLHEAFRICHEDFDQHDDFTASGFCQRLVETNPDIEIGKQTRLLFLQGVRQHDTKPESTREHPSSHSTSNMPAAQPVSPANPQPGIEERRRDFRKPTNLMGVYWHTLDKQQNGAMVVENISTGGCGLHILTPHHLKRGDTLRLEFKLDDACESFIRIHGQLRWVLYNTVGVQFQSLYGIPQALTDYVGS
ncbi:PilZ domain-containing protein [Candidatus Entotheonella palauensis]|uniref:PilZ domain-containing protein n=1 Tax=Candidatus Entotheonella gemina TaxID=1429439 RepID=W4MAB6_9BACT|nr:PilZ domain-containing protein [Candidatus Entotheonella palauensis]ETX06831.1 MAG: hypothetical protein ETSY2_14750 [Candidatus Entotheonella gemina]